MSKKPEYSETDDFGKHEVLDRAHIIEDLIAGKLLEHKAVIADAELMYSAQVLHDAAFAFYKLCGAKFL